MDPKDKSVATRKVGGTDCVEVVVMDSTTGFIGPSGDDDIVGDIRTCIIDAVDMGAT